MEQYKICIVVVVATVFSGRKIQSCSQNEKHCPILCCLLLIAERDLPCHLARFLESRHILDWDSLFMKCQSHLILYFSCKFSSQRMNGAFPFSMIVEDLTENVEG
jgi:hypothetical protein